MTNSEESQARRAVILKHARLRHGRPIFCTPSQHELSTGKNKAGWNTDGKIIFPNEAAAARAALDLQALGARPMRVYPCPRSDSGHAHLASLSTRRRRKRD